MRESTKKASAARGPGARRCGARIIGIVTSANRNDPAMWDALAACDIAEFRGDLFDPDRVREEFLAFKSDLSRRGLSIEILFTLRLQKDGGAWPDDHADRREAIWEGLGFAGHEPGSDWIDIEIEHYPGLPAAFRRGLERSGAKLILSHHDFEGCPEPDALRGMREDMLGHDPDAVKFAVTCADRGQVLDLLAFAREAAADGPEACVLSMGETGRATRVLGPVLGCPLTYGFLIGGSVAPGQLSAAALARLLEAFSAELDPGAVARPGSEAQLLDWAEARIQGDSLAE